MWVAGSLLQRQESQVLCVVAGWHLAHFETHLMRPRNYPTFPHSWHLPTASTDTTGVSASDWGRGAAHTDETIKIVGARDSAHSGSSQERHRRSQRLVQWGPAGTKTQSVPPTQEAWDALSGTLASYIEPSETEGNAHIHHGSECWIFVETKCCGIGWGQKIYMTEDLLQENF